MIDNLTICVPTFERPWCLARLLASIRGRYPGERILVADQGRRRPAAEVCRRYDAEYRLLPFDCGIAAARNYLAGEATTPVVFFVDDDMQFTRDTGLNRAYYMRRETKTDLLSIAVKYWGGEQASTYVGSLVKREEVVYRVKHPPQWNEFGVRGYDVVPNVFLANRRKILEIGWDERLKFSELLEFFWRARGKLRVGWTGHLSIDHYQVGHDSADPYYQGFVSRADRFKLLALRIMGCVDSKSLGHVRQLPTRAPR